MNRDIPHIHIVIGACCVAVAGYAVFSVYAVIWLRDATMSGDIIGTWKSFAVAAFAFWLGSSSGGKAAATPEAGSTTTKTTTTVEPAEDAPGTEAKPLIVAGTTDPKAPPVIVDAPPKGKGK